MKSNALAVLSFMVGSILMGFQGTNAQVLERDVATPTLGPNNTSSTEPPEISIDISPLESLPANGTVTMSLDDVVDTNMNEIPPQGVTVVINNQSVTVTNHPVTIEAQ
jgi:hypothetical protein